MPDLTGSSHSKQDSINFQYVTTTFTRKQTYAGIVEEVGTRLQDLVRGHEDVSWADEAVVVSRDGQNDGIQIGSLQARLALGSSRLRILASMAYGVERVCNRAGLVGRLRAGQVPRRGCPSEQEREQGRTGRHGGHVKWSE